MAVSPRGAGWLGQGEEKREGPCREVPIPTPPPSSRGCGGLTFVTEPPRPAGFALAEEVAHEVLADLGPLLTAGVWRALVRQV